MIDENRSVLLSPLTLFGRVSRFLHWLFYRLHVRAAWVIWDLLRVLHPSAVVERLHDTRQEEQLPEVPFRRRSERLATRLLKVRQEGAWIEKEYGFPMLGRLPIRDALAGKAEATSRDFSSMQFFNGYPSLSDFAFGGAKGLHYSEPLVSLRHPYEGNYYHATIDILGAIALADGFGLDRKAPLLIGPALARRPFFNDWQSMGELSQRNWVVQDSHVSASEIWVPQVIRPQRDLLLQILKMFALPEASGGSSDLLFVTRSTGDGRTLRNWPEIVEVLGDYDVKIFDPGENTLAEQIDAFRQASMVIGIHGAGLTNLLFRLGLPTRVREIFPPHDADCGFNLLCKELGFEWAPVLGHSATGMRRDSDFALDPRLLRRELEALRAPV